MKTWLDAYIVELNSRYELKTDPYYGSRSIIANAHSQLHVGSKWNETFEECEHSWIEKKDQFLPADIMEYLSLSENERREAFDVIAMMESEWFAMMTPFLKESDYAPLALQLAPELADALSQKRVEGWDSETFELLERHKSIYIDLPHGHFCILSHLQISCLIVRDMRYSAESYLDTDGKQKWRYVEHENGDIRVCAVITKLNSNQEEGRIHWTLSSAENPTGFTLSAYDFDTDVFKLEFEEFIKLILAYYLIAPIQSQVTIPHIDLENADRAERRAWERDKKFSLFGVTKLSLTPRQDVFELSTALRGSQKGWKLGRRIHIEPFPRMQWKGKKEERYQEKVIVGEKDGGFWKGPKNAPLKLKLFALV